VLSSWELEVSLDWIHSLSPVGDAAESNQAQSPKLASLAPGLRHPMQILRVVTGKYGAEDFCILNAHPLAAFFALSTVMAVKYLFLEDLAGNDRKNLPETRANLLIYKYFTNKSLFLKDLAEHAAKSLITKYRTRRGQPKDPRGRSSKPRVKTRALPKPFMKPAQWMCDFDANPCPTVGSRVGFPAFVLGTRFVSTILNSEGIALNP
jgi:hypothetical protein